MTVIALDVGGTRIKAGVMTADGTLVHAERRFTRAERGPDAVIDTVLGCASDLAAQYRPDAAGIAVPGRIVIGGGLARAGRSYFEPLRPALADRLTFRTAPRVVPAKLGHRAGCLGAALLAQDLNSAVGAAR